LNEPSLLAALCPRSLVCIGGDFDCRALEHFRSLLPSDALIALYRPGVFREGAAGSKGAFRGAMEGGLLPLGAHRISHTAYMHQTTLERIASLRPGKQISHQLNRLRGSDVERGWHIVKGGRPAPSSFTQAVTSFSVNVDNPIVFCAISLGEWKTSNGCRPLADRWIELVGTPLVPFDAGRRQQLEARAGAEFSKLLQVRRKAAAERKKRERKRGEEEDDETDHG
jgi:hypothetical protein